MNQLRIQRQTKKKTQTYRMLNVEETHCDFYILKLNSFSFYTIFEGNQKNLYTARTVCQWSYVTDTTIISTEFFNNTVKIKYCVTMNRKGWFVRCDSCGKETGTCRQESTWQNPFIRESRNELYSRSKLALSILTPFLRRRVVIQNGGGGIFILYTEREISVAQFVVTGLTFVQCFDTRHESKTD